MHLINLMVFRTRESTLWWSKKAMFLRKDTLTSPNTVWYAFRCIFIFHTDFQHHPLLRSAISQKSWIFSSSLPTYSRKEMVCLFGELYICQKNLVLLLAFSVQWDLTWISLYQKNVKNMLQLFRSTLLLPPKVTRDFPYQELCIVYLCSLIFKLNQISEWSTVLGSRGEVLVGGLQNLDASAPE